ncbi:hypothetical protein [Sulfitobacter sp. R18_1]|uniref:hypothetical protein n=1 Tax=Sulfitobacter sp. R18_1 TaxID=2821104 RepID=UPI001ADC9546|nr:hypothetical protein [Sulfitobacter sp. R18_1]MBO9428271.1 hypothetical protein [Sulfitobacter sp. R18_1]
MTEDDILSVAMAINGPSEMVIDGQQVSGEDLHAMRKRRWEGQTTQEDRLRAIIAAESAINVMAAIGASPEAAVEEPNVAKLIRCAKDLVACKAAQADSKKSLTYNVRFGDLAASLEALSSAVELSRADKIAEGVDDL